MLLIGLVLGIYAVLYIVGAIKLIKVMEIDEQTELDFEILKYEQEHSTAPADEIAIDCK
jgi:hypothetical protein